LALPTNGGTAPKLRHDDKELVFLDQRDNIVAVDVNTPGNATKLGVPHARLEGVNTR
jgi:hypothetical protein